MTPAQEVPVHWVTMVVIAVAVFLLSSCAASSSSLCSKRTLSLICDNQQDGQQCCRCTIPRYCGPSGGSLTQPGQEPNFSSKTDKHNFILDACFACISMLIQTPVICEFITNLGTFTEKFSDLCSTSQPVSPTPDMQSPALTPTPTVQPDYGITDVGTSQPVSPTSDMHSPSPTATSTTPPDDGITNITTGVATFIVALFVLAWIGCFFYCIIKKWKKPHAASDEMNPSSRNRSLAISNGGRLPVFFTGMHMAGRWQRVFLTANGRIILKWFLDRTRFMTRLRATSNERRSPSRRCLALPAPQTNLSAHGNLILQDSSPIGPPVYIWLEPPSLPSQQYDGVLLMVPPAPIMSQPQFPPPCGGPVQPQDESLSAPCATNVSGSWWKNFIFPNSQLLRGGGVEMPALPNTDPTPTSFSASAGDAPPQ